MNNFNFDLNEYIEFENKILSEVEEVYGGDKIFDLNKIISDYDEFKSMYGHIYYVLEEGFEIEAIRKFKVKVTFDKNNDHFVEMEIRHLLVNMIFLRAFVELEVDVELDDSYLFDARKISNKYIKKYIDEKIIIPFRDQFTDTDERFMELNSVLHDIIYRLNKIPKDFNSLMGITLNLENSFIKVAKENPRFNELIRTKIPEDMQPKDIENYLNDLMKEEIEILKSTDNCFQPMLIAGGAIKEEQLREFSINGGLKSDLLGNTIPIPINSNLVVGGFGNITNYYIDAGASRKSLIANKEKMGSSGHMSLLMKLSCVGTYISEMEDCHTPHTVKLTIHDNKFLEMCSGRYYRLPGHREFKLLKKTDKHLIGKTLLFRDPGKCGCKDGICKTCYGALATVNKGMDVGIFASTIISRPLSQNILSTKHLNTTNSCLIEFNDAFDKAFKLEANQVKMLSDNETEVDLSQYEMVFDNIIQIDELLDNADFNKFVQFIKVRNIKNPDELYEIVENEGKELFIHPDLDGIIKKTESNENNEILVPFSRLSEETLFTINIENNELTKPLKEMDKLLNGSYFKGLNPTLDMMEQRFIELLIESKINVMSIHAATILRSFVRDSNNYLERPDFNKLFVDYVVLGLHASLSDNPSITNSLAYDYLKSQLYTHTTFKKHKHSPLDLLFMKSLADVE
jgi:hypothetical protein